MSDVRTLALRLAGPLQSWGTSSQFNRRGTEDRPSKSGVVGLLAAAQGRRRGSPLDDLCSLSLAVRCDQPGVLMHDYHTVSDLDGEPLLSARVNARGLQVKTSPKKATHLTTRSYLQDAVFLALVSGPVSLLLALEESLRQPAFALALGRRSCPPSQPLLVYPGDDRLWEGSPRELVATIPWQAGAVARERARSSSVTLAVTLDDPDGLDQVTDVPVSFDQFRRGFTSRRVTHDWVTVPTGREVGPEEAAHDPFELLGW